MNQSIAGSSIYQDDFSIVLNECKKRGYSDENIIIDTIVSGNPIIPSVASQHFKAIGIMQRTGQLFKYYESLYGVMRIKQEYPKI
jgi:hypothetical protein